MAHYFVQEEDIETSPSFYIEKCREYEAITFRVSSGFYRKAKPALDAITLQVLNKSKLTQSEAMEFMRQYDLDSSSDNLFGLVMFYMLAVQRSYNIWVTNYEEGEFCINIRA